MIALKSKREIEIMAEGGKILAKIMRKVQEMIKPGITTRDLDKVAEDLVFRYGARPSFKGYQGFPATVCTSINEEIVHGIPSKKRKLRKGDIISLDMGILFKGFHSDMAATWPVGEVSPEAQRLIRVTKKALKRGIKKVRPGTTFGDIGNTIQRYVESQEFNIVRDLCGHGIGRNLHEEPKILNYGKRHTGPKLKPGMVLCLEPMVTTGDWHTKQKDTQTIVTTNGSLSAHFEQEVAVTKDGYTVLTNFMLK